MTLMRREYPGVQFARGIEVQDGARGGTSRGALHDHIAVSAELPLVPEVVQRLALQAGFGCVIDWQPAIPGSRAARYIAKYVTKSVGSRSRVPWERIDRRTGEIFTRPTFRSWSSSQRWGVRMREVEAAVRASRRAAAVRWSDELVQGVCVALGAVELLPAEFP